MMTFIISLSVTCAQDVNLSVLFKFIGSKRNCGGKASAPSHGCKTMPLSPTLNSNFIELLRSVSQWPEKSNKSVTNGFAPANPKSIDGEPTTTQYGNKIMLM